MPIERWTRRVSAARIKGVATSLLEASTLCAISTVSPGNRAHVNTAYFAWTEELDLLWLSDPRAQHSRNLRRSPSAAIAVYDSTQTWGKADRGIQLFGHAVEAAPALEEIYAKRFPAYEPTSYRLYRFRPNRLKVFDERVLGPGVFVIAKVGSGGRVTWQRTDRYR
jgi:uncharacterized protein YhbP (UPF0306 family)